jgi:small GTP-binding protein
MQGITYSLKYVVIGDSGVGKTCLLLKFTDKRFKTTHEVTIGVEYGTRVIKLENETLKLSIWDTVRTTQAGTESFKSIARAYYRGAAVALIVYDVTKRSTFDNMRSWIREIKEFGTCDTVLMVVGNKADEEGVREVATEEGMQMANEFGLKFTETSAVSGLGVELAFSAPAATVMERVSAGYYDLTNDVSTKQSTGIKKASAESSTRLESVYEFPPRVNSKCRC